MLYLLLIPILIVLIDISRMLYKKYNIIIRKYEKEFGV